MHKRRTFLKAQAMLLASLALPVRLRAEAAADLAVLPAAGELPDEAYWKEVRARFPLDSDRIFLNNGAMGICPQPVLQAVRDSFDNTYRNAIYGGGEKEVLDALAPFVGAGTDELALVHNVTEAINIVAWGLPLKKGDEVLMTKHEHVGNALPWLNRARVDGIRIKTVDLGATAAETLDNVNRAIGKRTKAIALPHIPCTIGQVLPAKDICTLARSKGLFTFIDGAHPPGMLQVDLHDIGCDFYASCCHKWMLAPQGTAFLYVRKEMQDRLEALFVGGYSDTGWSMIQEKPAMQGLVPSAHRYFYGTRSAALYKGVEAAIAFQQLIGRDRIEARVKALSGHLQQELLALGDGIQMLTPQEDISRGAQVAFRFRRKDTKTFQDELNKRRITVRYVPENEVNCLRISTHIYNSNDDIGHFMEAVKFWINA
jgi:cysteine desulfurase/selenocysteine lyase